MTGPPPAVAAVRAAVRRALPARGRLLVGCSGGADSLALAAALAREAVGRGALVSVDHGLQPGSRERAESVASWGAAAGLTPAEALTVEVVEDGHGPEAAARDARRAALRAAAGRYGAAAVLLGHTRDDQAEQVLLGLARGSGGRSLAGMRARAEETAAGVPGLVWLRPLLDLPRATTRAACAALGLRPWSDPHNEDASFARVRARQEALPALEAALGPGIAEALARTARLLGEDADALDGLAARQYAVCRRPGGLDLTMLAALPAALRARVLRLAAAAAGAAALTEVHVRALDALTTAWRGQGPVALPGGVTGRRTGLLLVLGPPRLPPVTLAPAEQPGSDGSVSPVPDPEQSHPEQSHPEQSHPEQSHPEQSHPHPDVERVLLAEDVIASKIAELAAEVDRDYAGQELLLIGVLKGAVMAMADLGRALSALGRVDTTLEFMAVSSYGASTTSSGVVRILKDLDRDITGRHVLVVEDVVDSGLTLSWLLRNLRSRGPASVEVCALLRKPEAARNRVDVRYVGFDIGDDFVVGYGLDVAERYRTLPYVARLRPEVLARVTG